MWEVTHEFFKRKFNDMHKVLVSKYSDEYLTLLFNTSSLNEELLDILLELSTYVDTVYMTLENGKSTICKSYKIAETKNYLVTLYISDDYILIKAFSFRISEHNEYILEVCYDKTYEKNNHIKNIIYKV